MGEAVGTLFIVIAVMSVSMVLFGGWVVVAIAKGVGRMVGQGSLLNGGVEGHICGRCRQVNPTTAHFCRRCGTPI